ncbi:MAG: oxidoreductase [Gammaproteobacteria bacterium]|nr:oxidoreductase [Gammaproteobacteria bacterium]
MAWQLEDLTPQNGRTVVITGGNSGIGFEAAKALADKDARVIIACRDQNKAQTACDQIKADNSAAEIEAVTLDLASLNSVRSCADELNQRCERLDVLINNAGVMAIPRKDTEDGFEMQIGTNHLGHFALTALLYPLLQSASDARVVTVSSLAHLFGFINFANLHGRMFYEPFTAYGQSKLANLLFTYELDRRLRAADVDVLSTACHPGIASTSLGYAGPRMSGSPLGETLVQLYTSMVAQSATDGALPTLYAGFAAEVQGGDYIGPDGLGEMRGNPRKVSSSFMSRSQTIARQLWRVSEEATGVQFAI